MGRLTGERLDPEDALRLLGGARAATGEVYFRLRVSPKRLEVCSREVSGVAGMDLRGGIKTPILVGFSREMVRYRNPVMVVLDGRRRTIAAQQGGMATVPVAISESDLDEYLLHTGDRLVIQTPASRRARWRKQ